MMKNAILSLLLTVILVPSLNATDVSVRRKENLDKLISYMVGSRDTIIDAIKTVVAQHMESLDIRFREQHAEQIKGFIEDLLNNCMKDMFSVEVINKICDVYCQHFYDVELEEMVRLYESSFYKKMMAHLPEIMQQMNSIMVPVMQSHMNDFAAKVNDLVSKSQTAEILPA